MKNFPNQVIDLDKVRTTLNVIEELNKAGADVTDDRLLGYQLARAGSYGFQGLTFVPAGDAGRAEFEVALEARIVLEKKKPKANQGAETNARESRRQFLAMGWLDTSWRLTQTGRALVSSSTGSAEERALLRLALLGLTVREKSTGELSHPALILLALLRVKPSNNRDGLELALEAENDSEAELERVTTLYGLSPADRLDALKVAEDRRPGSQKASDTTVKNARKILPPWCVAAGLAEITGTVMSITADGLAALEGFMGLGSPAGETGDVVDEIEDRSPRATRKRTRMRQPRNVTPDTAGGRLPNPRRRRLTESEDEIASARLAARTAAHQQIVRALAGKVDALGTLSEDAFSYDLLLLPHESEVPFLFEVKSVREHDGEAQVRNGIAQLLWYERFDVPGSSTHRVLVTDRDLEQGIVDFLDELGISLLVYEQDDDWHIGGNWNLETMEALGFQTATQVLDSEAA